MSEPEVPPADGLSPQGLKAGRSAEDRSPAVWATQPEFERLLSEISTPNQPLSALPMLESQPSDLLQQVLPPSLELVTALNEAADDPEFFWSAMRRVVGESLTANDPGTAIAQLLFGVSATASILLAELSAERGIPSPEVLAELRSRYMGI